MASEQAKKAIRTIDGALIPFEGTTEVVLNADMYLISDEDKNEIESHYRGSGYLFDMTTRPGGNGIVHHVKLTLFEASP